MKKEPTADNPPPLTPSQLAQLLGEWKGYELGTVGRRPKEGDAPEEVWIELRPCPSRSKVCSGCHQPVDSVHDTEERWVRDLPLLGTPVNLLVHRCRLACPRCGPKVEHLDWLGRHQRVTRRLAESVARLAKVLPLKHVAEHFRLHWSTVKEIDKRCLKETLGAPDLGGLEVIAMDEFAIQKGHRYATIMVEPRRGQVLWVCRGRGREDIRPFFEALGEEGRSRIQAAVMDMSEAFAEEVRHQCPNAQIV